MNKNAQEQRRMAGSRWMRAGTRWEKAYCKRKHHKCLSAPIEEGGDNYRLNTLRPE